MVKYRTLDGTFGALAHPTRRQMMMRLREGDATVSELAAPHAMSLPAASKHVRVLEDAGLILRRKEGREQRCSLASSPLREATSWLRRFSDDGSGGAGRTSSSLRPRSKRTTRRKEKHG